MAEIHEVDERGAGITPPTSPTRKAMLSSGQSISEEVSVAARDPSEKSDQVAGAIIPYSPPSTSELSDFKFSLCVRGVAEETAGKVSDWYATHWRDFFVEGQSSDPPPAITGITSFKVYRDPTTNELVGEIGIGGSEHGSCKRPKSTVQLRAGGGIQRGMRLTSVDKTPEAVARFTSDITIELKRRRDLGPIPHLLKIYPVIYRTTSGISTRYITQPCDGSVFELIFDPQSEMIVPLAKSKRQTIKALLCCLDALKALIAIHDQGYAHRDIKPENILFIGNVGLLCDLGSSESERDTEKLPCGSVGYIAPEIILCPQSDRCKLQLFKADVFSFALVVLAAVDPDINMEIQAGQYSLLEKKIKPMDYYALLENYKATLEKGNALSKVIASSLAFDPGPRPTCKALYPPLERAIIEFSRQLI